MREIRTEIYLNAPIEVVWKTLTDFENWQKWNPTVVRVHGSPTQGSNLEITMSKDNCDEMIYKAQVVEVVPPHQFRWRAKMMAGFVFTNDRIFQLSKKDNGTHFVHIESYSGIMAAMSWNKLSEFVPKVLEKMNQALKNELEK